MLRREGKPQAGSRLTAESPGFRVAAQLPDFLATLASSAVQPLTTLALTVSSNLLIVLHLVVFGVHRVHISELILKCRNENIKLQAVSVNSFPSLFHYTNTIHFHYSTTSYSV